MFGHESGWRSRHHKKCRGMYRRLQVPLQLDDWKRAWYVFTQQDSRLHRILKVAVCTRTDPTYPRHEPLSMRRSDSIAK